MKLSIAVHPFRWLFFSFVLSALSASATTYYVDQNNSNPTPPYMSWATAATNIQDALDASSAGDLILVTNGVYATGGRNWAGSGTNRVTLTNNVTLESVNGPAVTLIVGSHVPGSSARCVGIGNGAVLSGFTLTNGEAGGGNYPSGGGVAAIAGTGTVSNCVLVSDVATNSAGGGAYRVTLINCQLVGNYAGTGGGACACTLINCMIVSNTASTGGGIYGGTTYGASVLTNCVLSGNSAANGGGASGGTLIMCTLSNNTATADGGGANNSVLCNSLVLGNSAVLGGGLYSGVATNCTVVFNTATNQGGGVYGGTGAWCYNSIFYYNNAPTGSNSTGTKFSYSCTNPNPFGGGISNAPVFVNLAGGDFHLNSNSPCIDGGNNIFVQGTTDLDGNPRIVDGTVDMGCYEYQGPATVIPFPWLLQYGLPTDGSADYTDLDGSGFTLYQDWVAGLNPTNRASVLAMMRPAKNASGIRVTWQSVSGIYYNLQRSTNLPVFINIQSNILSAPGTNTSYIDTSATNNLPYFYRVGVVAP